MKPEAIIREVHAQFDYRWAKTFGEMGCGTTCTKGCHACCAEPLLVNREEAKLILKVIPETKRAAVRDRVSVWIERAESSGILNEKLPRADKYLKLGLMCPLMENGLCLVYENRPLGCRQHVAIGDPALCHDPDKRLTQRYALSPELDQQCSLMTMGAAQEADHLGVYLARWLLSRKVTSVSEMKYPVAFDGIDANGCMQLRQLKPQ